MDHVLPDEFDSRVLNNKEKILVLFYADWCPYCANFKPNFEEIRSDKVQKKAALVNGDENPLWDRFNIQTVPTMIAFQNGQIVARRDAKWGVGLTRKDMESLIDEL